MYMMYPEANFHLPATYLTVATHACHAVRFAAGMDALRFGLITGEIPLDALLQQTFHCRKAVVETAPFIDVYLGDTKVYKRVSKALLYSFCQEIGRFLGGTNGRWVIQLPEGFSNALSVKLAVLYMEEYVQHPEFRQADWRVGDDIFSYICLAELFERIGMPKDTGKLEDAIFRRFREKPLRIEQIRAIWAREKQNGMLKYAEALADNIFTFMCVPKIERLLAEHDIGAKENYEQRVSRKLRYLARRYPETGKLAMQKAQETTELLAQYLEHPTNFRLKQLVYTANSFRTPKEHADPEEYITIKTVKEKVAGHRHLAGVKKIALMKKGEVDEEVS